MCDGLPLAQKTISCEKCATIGRSMRAFVVFTLAGVVVSGCQCGPPRSGLSITVDFDRSASRCVAAGVQVDDTMVFHGTTKAIARSEKATLIFGVVRTDTIKGKVIPFARGYSAMDCASVELERFDEVATGELVDLDAPGVSAVTLTLRGPAANDGGTDGGVDAGRDAGVDAGCEALDCADLACDARPCGGDAGVCGMTSDGGRACVQTGPETLCADSMDNDDDGAADCADADCTGLTCSDQNGCTTTDTCQGGLCDPGAGVITCPPNTTIPCRGQAGQCVPATGSCLYPPLDAGSACDDGLSCTHSDVCGAVADCTGTPYTCTATTCAANAQCNGLGGCTYTIATSSTPCDDATSCTHTDRCTDGGVCTGTGYACTPPPCFTGTACDGDGGCLFSFNGVDTRCPGGVCRADGGCERDRAFGYVPSNFFPDDIPDASIAPATVFTGCTVEFDTSSNTFVDGGWCNQVKPTPYVFVQDGGVSTTVLPMEGFELSAGSTLILYGSRPVILAVYGPAAIHGVIDARSIDATRVGPGGNWSGCGLMNGGHALLSAGGGGAGFGTAGARGGGAGFGDGGLAGTNSLLQPLTGGCLGGRGHDSSSRYEAPGGPGGGAVQLSSSGVLTVTGTISTSGGGGQGGFMGAMDHNGGGGGGSGGAILLEGQQLSLAASARLTCNGGAGGGGREDGLAIGVTGQGGSLTTTTPAIGGQGGTPPAGDGGSGAAGLLVASPGVAGVGIIGSGGGGAGLGVIRLNGVSLCSIDAGVVLSGAVTRSPSCP